MARKAKQRPPSEVQPGDTYALPLGNGRWGAVLVLRKRSEPDEQMLVRATAWFGDAPPADATDPLLTAPLIRTHHHYGQCAAQPLVYWIRQPVPADAVGVGRITLRPEDAQAESDSYGTWDPHRNELLAQWRWDHERDEVRAEEAQRDAEHHEYLHGYRRLGESLEDLREYTHFPYWPGYVEAGDLRLSRRIVRDLIDELIALGPDGDEVTKLDAFRRAVGRFNEAEFVGSPERDDIRNLFDRIADAAGLSDHDVIAGRRW
jgi:hypothetical protein